MDITRSTCCRRLSFVNRASCPHCGQAFLPGTLQARAVAEDRAFNQKVYGLFLVVFIALAAVSVFILLQHPAKSPAVSHLEHIPAFTITFMATPGVTVGLVPYSLPSVVRPEGPKSPPVQGALPQIQRHQNSRKIFEVPVTFSLRFE